MQALTTRAVIAVCGLLLSAHAAGADTGRVALVAHAAVIKRASFFRVYSASDEPVLVGGELTVAGRSSRFGLGLDVAHGRSSTHLRRLALTTIGVSMLYEPLTGARMVPFLGVGGLLVQERNQFVAFGSSSIWPMARGRAGVAIRLTPRVFVRPEALVDANPGFNFMASARIGIGWTLRPKR